MNKTDYNFPSSIYCGDLNGKKNSIFPFVMPEEIGGFTVLYNNEEKSNNFIESVMLNLLNTMPLDNIEINIFDYSLRKRFPYLSELRSSGIYNILNKSSLAKVRYNELEDIIRNRHDELLSPEITTISQYNAVSKFHEKYYILILNLSNFPDDYILDDNFIDFINTSREAGIYIISFMNISKQNTKKESIKYILDYFPTIEISDKINIKEHRSTRRLKELLARYDLDINLLNLNNKDLSKRLLSNINNNEQDDEKDFLVLDIATSLNGKNDIKFIFGEKSKNFHALIIGASGTGKSTLLNNIIIEIAKHYTSKEVELYLMDFKEGIEFNQFSNHPNCKKIFLENKDAKAAKNLLLDFKNEIELRGKIFKKEKVRDITQYNELEHIERIPNIILIVDEAQQLFTGSYNEIKQLTELLLDLSKRGRSFGLNLILSTQTLVGTEISKALMSQISLRIAYKVYDQADAEKVFSYNNYAPLNLQKYELIYNNNAGNKENNVVARANNPQDIEVIIEQIRHTRDASLCITPEVIRSETIIQDNILEEKQSTKHKPTSFNFLISKSNDKKYDTNEELEAINKLKTLINKEKKDG